MKFTIRVFAVICVAVTSTYVMLLGNKINDTLASPDWCGRAIQAEKLTGTRSSSSCTDLLKIQLSSLSINSHILLGTVALCLGVLIVIVVAGAKFSGSVDEHGATVNVEPTDKPIPVQVTNPPESPVPVSQTDEGNPQ